MNLKNDLRPRYFSFALEWRNKRDFILYLNDLVQELNQIRRKYFNHN